MDCIAILSDDKQRRICGLYPFPLVHEGKQNTSFYVQLIFFNTYNYVL